MIGYKVFRRNKRYLVTDRKNSMIRVVVFLFAMILAQIYFGIPDAWMAWVIYILLFLYLCSEILDLISRFRIAGDFEIYIDEYGFTFKADKFRGRYNFNDLSIMNVSRGGGHVKAIKLMQRGGRSVVLKGLDDMDDLYEIIKTNVASNS